MSVIQKIRDKYARWAVIAIAVSLLGFILMDAFAGRTSLFGRNSTTIGRINGKKIDYIDFDRKVKAQEEMARQQGYDMGDAGRQQVIESVWNSEITQNLMTDEFDKLGMTIGKKELNDILFGENPPQDLRQRFTNQSTGQYDALAAQQFINNLKKNATAAEKAQLNDYLASLEMERLMTKYTSLLSNSTYFPKWYIEKQNTDNSLIAKIGYVSIPYTTISDSAVKITDKEIQQYISDHKNEYKQEQETRNISYVVFPAIPTAADSAAVRTQIENLRPPFATTNDAATFLAQQGSSIQYFDGYTPQSKIQVPAKDSIFNLPKGGVYGPYLDGNNYVLAKLIDSRILPDSVKARHILLGTVDPQTNQPLIPDSMAKKTADSIAAAIAGGANFDTLETRYSTDRAAHQQKGVMTFSSMDIQGPNFAKEFGQFILFDGKPGDKKVVKTQFGYHYIEIMEHKDPEPHYKVAYLAKPIEASTETDNAASNAASMFAGDSRNLKDFNANYDKSLRNKGIAKLVASDIKPNDYSIVGLGASRPFVKAIFEADKGDVLEPQRVGDNYVVAVVTDVSEAGLASVASARNTVEPILRNKKKAAQIKQKLGKITTLEAVSTAMNQPVQTADSLRFNGQTPGLGYESKIIGASFNPANKGKVIPQPLEGQAGVYMVRVDAVSTVPIETANIEEKRRMLEMQARQMMMYRAPIESLRKAADIKDYRDKFF
ncbi:MAG: SurA N-terminal domain-containing protein [Flavisolibacter sp.]|nr:SurA N-terminal domain-containing protein [Flavisolibacter sp.]MBD0364511.1 SurA N-terminal domain-containing protein [Flavisolibacter sp.]